MVQRLDGPSRKRTAATCSVEKDPLRVAAGAWTGVSPTAAYWRPTVLREDTRIPARSTDVTNYEFIAPTDSGDVLVQAKLMFRRAFKDLADQKRWAVPDIVMATSRLTLRPFP
jgi:hypothetical protein